MSENFTTPCDPFAVRRFEHRDRQAVLALWPAAVMHLQPGLEPLSVLTHAIAGTLTGKHHLWVAEAAGRIIGATAVIRIDATQAHLNCLCVIPDWAQRQAVANHLADTAIRDAWERGYLKLVVHTPASPGQLAAILHELGFEFSRERAMGTEHVLEFYRNLYERPRYLQARDRHKDFTSRHFDGR